MSYDILLLLFNGLFMHCITQGLQGHLRTKDLQSNTVDSNIINAGKNGLKYCRTSGDNPTSIQVEKCKQPIDYCIHKGMCITPQPYCPFPCKMTITAFHQFEELLNKYFAEVSREARDHSVPENETVGNFRPLPKFIGSESSCYCNSKR